MGFTTPVLSTNYEYMGYYLLRQVGVYCGGSCLRSKNIETSQKRIPLAPIRRVLSGALALGFLFLSFAIFLPRYYPVKKCLVNLGATFGGRLRSCADFKGRGETVGMEGRGSRVCAIFKVTPDFRATCLALLVTYPSDSTLTLRIRATILTSILPHPFLA